MKKMLDKYGLNAISVHQVYTGVAMLDKTEDDVKVLFIDNIPAGAKIR